VPTGATIIAVEPVEAMRAKLLEVVPGVEAAGLAASITGLLADDDRNDIRIEAALVKLYASEMAGRAADRALQILGGRGYMTESPAARFYRELRVDRIWEGTSEIQRLIIANGLFKRGAAPYLGWE